VQDFPDVFRASSEQLGYVRPISYEAAGFPGRFASLLGGLATWYFLLEPQFSFTFSQQRDGITLISYFAVAIAISFLPQASSPLGGRAK
jgi:K+-sensing histidine kinase KdpD